MTMHIFADPHPDPIALEMFALGTSSDADHRRIRDHVAECVSCRERVVTLVATGTLTPDRGAAHGIRPDALDRILAGRRRGLRILLPHGDAPRPSRLRRRAPAYAAAAAAVLIGIASVVFSSNELTASDVSGELRFMPELPAPGDSIRVEYRGARFGRDTELRLRALLRTAHDEEPEWAARYGTVATLRRDRDDVYRGTVVLPESIVYGAFVVEDTTGEEVDTRGGRLWDVLIRDDRGRPAFDAMRQQLRFHYGRDEQRSLPMARELVKVHSDNPESWRKLLWHEMKLVGAVGRADVHARHRRPFSEAHRRLRASSAIPPHVMATMWEYAAHLGEDSLATYWSRRLAAEHPRSPEGAIQRYFALPEKATPAARDSALEQIWRELSPTTGENIASIGFMRARTTSDTAGLRKWGERLERIAPPWNYRSFVGYTMARTPGLEADGAERLRAHLREFGQVTDLHRVIGENVQQHRQSLDRTRASALVALGHALDAMDYSAAALDTLELAVQLAWDASAYLKIAELKLRRGDSTAAARAAAYAYADGSVPAASTALRQRAGAISDSTWLALVNEGRAVQRRQLLATSIDRPLTARARIKDSSGRERELADVVRGAPTVVAFWSRYCPGSIEQLPALQRAFEQLAPTGARVVAITAETPSPALTAWLKEKGYTFDVYHDSRHEAASVLQPWGTPDHLVLDATGRLRFQRVRAKDVVGRVEVLRP